MRLTKFSKKRGIVATALAATASIACASAAASLPDHGATTSRPTKTTNAAAIKLPSAETSEPVSVSVPTAATDSGRTRTVAATDAAQVPSAALAAYQRAETIINAAQPSCQLRWQLLAGIGAVESDHGRTGGNAIDSDGVSRPGVFGPELNGTRGTTKIVDTDAGLVDGDTNYDRAVGPMQFIPSTWSLVRVDADGDGERNPQDIDDASLASAVYLCDQDPNLSTTAGERAALLRYNHSRTYADAVLNAADAFGTGWYTPFGQTMTAAAYLSPDIAATGPKATKKPAKPTKPATSTPPSTQPDPVNESTTQPGAPQPTEEPKPTKARIIPKLPKTGIAPVDQTVTTTQTILECALTGLLNPLVTGDNTTCTKTAATKR